MEELIQKNKPNNKRLITAPLGPMPNIVLSLFLIDVSKFESFLSEASCNGANQFIAGQPGAFC